MKNKITKIAIVLLSSVFLLILNACDDNSQTFTISDTPISPVLSELNITQIEIDAVNTANPAISLNWQEADFGQQASISYAVQFANDEAFTNAVTTTTITGQNSITLSMAELNSAAGNAGLNPFEWATIYCRVIASLGTQSSNEISSNSIHFSVFPFFNYPFKDFYMVGDATSPGWDNNNNNPPLFRDANDENLYRFTGFYADGGHFKVLEIKGLWQPQWGTNDGSSIEVNPGTGSDPERFPTAGVSGVTEGFYTFTINFATNTFNFESFDASGIISPSTLSIQGSSVSATTSMNSLTFDGHIWFLNSIHLIPGDLEFLTNSGAIWGNTTSFSGISTEGGGSIPVVVEDDYDVWFNDLTGEYIMIPLNL